MIFRKTCRLWFYKCEFKCMWCFLFQLSESLPHWGWSPLCRLQTRRSQVRCSTEMWGHWRMAAWPGVSIMWFLVVSCLVLVSCDWLCCHVGCQYHVIGCAVMLGVSIMWLVVLSCWLSISCDWLCCHVWCQWHLIEASCLVSVSCDLMRWHI